VTQVKLFSSSVVQTIMSILKRKNSKNQYLYRSVRKDGKVRKVYLGVMGGPSVELSHRTQRLNEAIQTSERGKRSAEIQCQRQTSPVLEVATKIAARWRCLDSLFIASPDWDQRESLNAPYGWAGNPVDTLNVARNLLMVKKQTPAEYAKLLRAAENNDPEVVT